MAAVANFCPRSIWLERGELKEFGDTAGVISRYLERGGEDAGEVAFAPESAPGSDAVRLLAVRTKNAGGQKVNSVPSSEPLTIEVEYQTLRKTSGLRIGVTVSGKGGEMLLQTKDLDVFPGDLERPAGTYVSRCELPGNFLNVGQFFISVGSDFPMIQAHFSQDRLLSFNVETAGEAVGGHIPDGRGGLLRMKLPWTMEQVA